MSASMFASVSHTEHPPRSYILAVRIVWTDQWLSATFDDGWKVSDLKRWLLAKLSNTDFAPPRARAPSPITFVAPRYEDEKDGEGWEGEDGEWGGTFSFEGPVMAPAPVAAGAGAHALVAFSTGLVLDDEARLGYYNLGEDELLELHPAGCVVRLGRGSVREYVRPYVLARVNVLRYVNPLEPETPAHSGKRRKVKLEWKARWLEINDGQLRILKAVTDSIAVFVADLDNLAMLELADAHLPHNAPIPSQHCATLTFRLPAPISSTSPSLFTDPFAGSTPIASPQSDNEPVSRDRQMSADSVTSNEEPHTWGPLYSPQPAQSPSSQQPDKKSTYLVLDMADAHTHTHVLRVLHRHAPHTLSSVFVPASCLPYTPTSPKLTSSSGTNAHANVHLHADADGRPPHAYPEWRASLARKAQRAGLGPVPHALAVALYGAGALPSTQPQQSRHSTSTVTFASARFEDDTPPVELEWDNWPLDLPRQARKTVTASQEQREREREREREKEREWEWDREDVPPLPTREKRLSAAGYGRRASTVAPLPFSDLAPVPSTSQSQVEMSSSPTSTYSHAAYPPADSVASHDSAGTSTEHVHAPVPHYVQHEVGVGGRTTEAALLSSYSRALSPDAPAILPLLSPGSTSTVISAAASSSYSSKLSSKEEKRREKERVKRERERMEDSGVLGPMSRKGKGKEKREREETATFSSFGTSSSGSRREREEQSKGSAKTVPPTSASAPSGIARARSMTVGGDSSFLNLASSREGSVRSDLSGIASKSKGKGKARAAMSVSEAGVSVDTFGDPPSVNESSATLWTGIQGPQGVMTSTVSVGSGSGSSVGTKRDRVDSGKGCPPKPKEKDGKEKEKDKKKGVFGGLRQLRPDKIVKGLDSALDFVDGRR